MSVITLAELYVGVREGESTRAINSVKAFQLVPFNIEIARQGGLFRRGYFRSHGTGLPDALIAATAEHEQATLVTLNQKHFPMLSQVLAPYEKK